MINLVKRNKINLTKQPNANEQKFYILNSHTKQFETREGKKKYINNVTCFVSQNDADYWIVTEAKTGLAIAGACTMIEAIQKAKEGIEKQGERLEYIIQNAISKYGLSPLYKESTAN